jgi:hypothetical protein
MMRQRAGTVSMARGGAGFGAPERVFWRRMIDAHTGGAERRAIPSHSSLNQPAEEGLFSGTPAAQRMRRPQRGSMGRPAL